MSRIQWLENNTTGLSGALELSVNAQHTKATYELGDGGALVFTGDHLKMKGGELVDGSIDKVVFKGVGGTSVIVATGNYDAAHLGSAAAEGSAFGVYMSLFMGNDTVIGSDGADSLVGLRGDDVISGGKGADALAGGQGDNELTGGKQSDTFVFEQASGVCHDIIHDLHVSGAQSDSLAIDQEVTRIKSVHGGEDTMLTLANSSTILIEHVTKAEFIDYFVV